MWLNTIQDDGFREIQLNGKQLVFLFMAATVVSVVIFLCGVLVGRGVAAERGVTDVASMSPPAETPHRCRRLRTAVAAAPAPDRIRRRRAAPPPADDLSYFDRLEKSNAADREAEAGPRRRRRRSRATVVNVAGIEARAGARREAHADARACRRAPRRRKDTAPRRGRAARRRPSRPGQGFAVQIARAQRSQRGRSDRASAELEGLCGVRAVAGHRHAVGVSRARRQVRHAARSRDDRGEAAKGRAVQALGYALAVASGALLALSFPKFGHPAFAWIALAPLLVALDRHHRCRRAFSLGLVTGVVYFAGTLYWITHVMAVYGGLATAAGVLVNAALMSRTSRSFPAFFALIVRRLALALRAPRALGRAVRVGGDRARARLHHHRLSVGAARLQPGERAADRAAGEPLRRVRRVVRSSR